MRPTILGIKRDYDCFDINFRRYAGERWTVKYDPDDLGEVLAVSEDGSLRFMLTEKYVQPMALADRKPGDAAELQKVMQFNRDLEQHETEQLAEAYGKTEQLIQDNPQIGNILGRLLICDSDGQHKLPKARKRLQATEAEAVEIPIVPKAHRQRTKTIIQFLISDKPC